MRSSAGATHSARFAEIWIASLAPTLLVGYQLSHGGGQLPKYRARGASPCAVRPRPVLSPGDRPPLLRAVGNGAGSDRHGALVSTSVGSLVVERKKDQDFGAARHASLRHSDNGRLSTPWREVIFFYTVTVSMFELSSRALV
jgi:hypothetical protein